jgi:predicted GNAT family acetyltransferase
MRIGDAIAYVDYSRAPGVTTLRYARVPDELAGAGVGSALARATLEAVRQRGDRVVAACGFIAAFIERHPEFHGLLADQPAGER